MPSTPRDKHFSEWYLSDCVFTNVRHVIHSIAVLIEETIPPPCPPPTNTSSRGEETTSLMSMFQPAPSAISGICNCTSILMLFQLFLCIPLHLVMDHHSVWHTVIRILS